MYTYSQFTLLYSRNQHNITKQLYANQKKKVIHELEALLSSDIESATSCNELEGKGSLDFVLKNEKPGETCICLGWPPYKWVLVVARRGYVHA